MSYDEDEGMRHEPYWNEEKGQWYMSHKETFALQWEFTPGLNYETYQSILEGYNLDEKNYPLGKVNYMSPKRLKEVSNGD